MIKHIIAGLLLGIVHGATVPMKAEPTKGYYTMDAMGCMILRECTKDVKRIKSIQDIKDHYPNRDFSSIDSEFDDIITSFDRIGVGVFLGNEKYFPPGHRGVYHTVSNNFFLNESFMHRQSTLMAVTRHEGWHAAQDCMAGTIDNSLIAIIHNEEDVPKMWQAIAKDTYKMTPGAIPWEKEAFWAGHTEGMTAKALDACATGKMWEVYKPTPLTEEWLRENNYIK